MPNIRTHDRITIIVALPLSIIAGTTAALVGNPVAPALAIAGHLFSGFMFGPDLDCISRPYYRWGFLRWLWVPYRKMIPRHRSVFSHGPAIGTSLRIVYLAAIFAILAMCYFLVAALWLSRSDVRLLLKERDWAMLLRVLVSTCGSAIAFWAEWLVWVKDGVLVHKVTAISAWCGLEVGAASHYLADAIGSGWKRRMKKQAGETVD